LVFYRKKRAAAAPGRGRVVARERTRPLAAQEPQSNLDHVFDFEPPPVRDHGVPGGILEVPSDLIAPLLRAEAEVGAYQVERALALVGVGEPLRHLREQLLALLGFVTQVA
jgi:hypothetical protein